MASLRSPSYVEPTTMSDEEKNDHSSLYVNTDVAYGNPSEGSLRAWMTMIGVSFVTFATYGMLLAFGGFQDYYTLDSKRILLSNFTPSDISWIGSTQTFLLFAMGLFTGKWFDDGHFHRMVIPGTVIYLVSFFTLSLCRPQQYYQFFLTQGLGMGIGMGLLAIPCVSVLSHYFEGKRGLATGTVFIATPLGGLIWPIAFNKLTQNRMGFAWGIRIAAFVCLFLLLAANFLIKTRRSERGPARIPILQGIRRALTDIPLFLCGLGSLFPYNYIQLFATLQGFPVSLAQNTLTMLFASAIIFGRILPGILGDRYGMINVVLIYTVIGGALIFLMLGIKLQASLIIFTLLYGPCGSVFVSLFSACVSYYTKDTSEYGLRLGVAGLVYAISTLIGTPINGALLQPPKYNWEAPVVFSGVIVLAGSLVLFASRQLVARKNKTSIVE